ncbi:TonB-dependent receptor domain-containing protein [Paremcibacter congregatus]|uniref:TonB-dependent receptor n=1 Tax=Paremcibacter congregatus TaxID=2043170 RepID=A0A2G4YSF0_9PROT|nr:TonB-dependent receptor [Paremcibacter congregatus]PHZ84376.1 TonB-dependent receptor [Paremcibacter congregatus]QDE28595.1 TonB-dependent receptor [Paremcibacter congregatus]
MTQNSTKNLILTTASTLALMLAISAPVSADETDDQKHSHGHEAEIEELFVTGAPHSKTRLDVLQGSNLISGEELDQRLEASIGETLSGIPGISSTFFGPGASRPIIRGLGGDRIRMLINGIGSIDASSTSPDHSVAADPLTAERIEVLRGASTLLYGSNAVGGVVNIIDGRIPSLIPEGGFEGRARLSYSSVADDVAGGASVNARLTGTDETALVLHLDGTFRNTGNYDIPGFSESAVLRATEEEEENGGEEEAFGTVENSDVDNKSGAVGLSWIGKDALFGISYSRNDSNYGVPGHHHHEEDHADEAPGEHEEEEEAPVRIDLDQKRFDLKGNLTRDFAIFEEARLRFGYADYKHTELEGSEIGTIFTNKGWEGRLELIQKEIGNLHGSMGLQLRERDFEAIGAEAFVPPTTTRQWGIFAVEELSLDPVTLEFGARFDHQSVDNKALGQTRSFSNISLSAGGAYHPTAESLIGLSLGRTERAPTAEELFSNGPHLATSAFEVGNPNLDKERATSLELTLKQESDRLTASLNLYHTWYDDFIFEAFTGQQEGGLNILEFRQRDARFYGAELEVDYLAYSVGTHNIWLNLSGDLVRAKFTGDLGNLPRIPAKSATVGFAYEGETLGASGSIRFVDDQTNLAASELMTEGYTDINMEVSWRPFGDDQDLTLRLQGKNLSNAERRQHTSFLKDLLPMPGRSVKISATYGF